MEVFFSEKQLTFKVVQRTYLGEEVSVGSTDVHVTVRVCIRIRGSEDSWMITLPYGLLDVSWNLSQDFKLNVQHILFMSLRFLRCHKLLVGMDFLHVVVVTVMFHAISNNIPCQSKFRLLSKLSLRNRPVPSSFRLAYLLFIKERGCRILVLIMLLSSMLICTSKIKHL